MDDLTHLELHRAGIGLAPSGKGQEGAAIHVDGVPGLSTTLRSCTCGNGRSTTCSHLKELSRAVLAFREVYGTRPWGTVFEATPWFRLARLLSEDAPQECSRLRVEWLEAVGERPSGVRFRAERSTGQGASQAAVESVARFDQVGGGTAGQTRGEELGRWLAGGPSRVRLLERLGKAPADLESSSDRAGVLERLAMFQWSKQEHQLAKAGMKTRRQTLEEGFWHRFAYHAVRELGPGGTRFHPAVDRRTGRFTLVCRWVGASSPERAAGVSPIRREAEPGDAVAEITLPRESVQRVLALLSELFPDQDDLRIRPIPLKTIFHVSPVTEIRSGEDGPREVDVRPVIQALQRDGEERWLEQAEVEKFRYGRLIYLEDLGVLAELERVGKERRFKAPRRLRLDWSRVPSFLDEHRDGLAEGLVAFDGLLQERRVFHRVDSVSVREIEIGRGDGGDGGEGGESAGGFDEAEGRSWYWLAVHYGFGDSTVSLAHVLDARSRGVPYLETPDGWVDLRAPGLGHLDRLLERFQSEGGLRDRWGDQQGERRGERLRLSAGELLGLQAATGQVIRVEGEAEAERAEVLRRLVELRPASPYTQPAGLETPLRPYQERGVEWLRFLWENRLGGILADDMGLGKTHQALALIAGLQAAPESESEATEAGATATAPPVGREVTRPVLVVCPTSVISHWRDKLRDHAPGLTAAIHHGPARDLGEALGGAGSGGACRVVITSYGVLRRDVAELAEVPWALAVFDEIQNLKNSSTRGWRAAAEVPATVRLGLTGTPIENSLTELKALFDLVLPGYLGSDQAFEDRFGDGEELPGRERLAELRRLISPFILRRTKEAVLDELPEKIEDVRTARLSEDQVKLYREAVSGRGKELVRQIAGGTEPVPYIHVFALLNLLKQVCDHPALALGEVDRPERVAETASGKWDLYRELLTECLDAGLKIVVFTQYLGMIELMERDLEERSVGYVTLTGSSRKRGEIIDRFNRDPDCRVFVGSLKAGGTGIDLIGGSVVIHYDRWWNAAREDQATDRVHRIGQRRAVQVFKLVTEGTLEEKIHALIERKRQMMNAVVREDDHLLAKVFSREELLDLLAEPL